MTTKVEMWGDSLAVRIPKTIVGSVGIEKGTELEVSIRDQEIILRHKKSEATLDELLSKITFENRHKEIDLGQAGNELL